VTSTPASPAWRYAKSGYKRVSGWLTPLAVEEFVVLMNSQRDLGIGGPVCEVGAHLGKTFILLHLLAADDEFAVAFDLYELQNEQVGRERKRRLLDYLHEHGGDPARIGIVTCDSLTLTPAQVQEACKGQPRMFSIDAGRSAGAVFSDLALAKASIREGGLVSITDYFQEGWPEVSEGAARFMHERGGLHPVAIGGNKFFLTDSAGAASKYHGALTREFGNRVRPSVAFGMPVLLLRPETLRTRLTRTKLWRSVRGTSFAAQLRALGTRGR
jgi:hypothetical protein